MTDRTTNAGEHWHYSHDALDRITAITNPAGGEAKFTYDALGRVTKADDENGNTTCYEYTPNGNLAKVTDALGNETFYQYDAMGHLTQSSCTEQMGKNHRIPPIPGIRKAMYWQWQTRLEMWSATPMTRLEE